MQKHGKPLAVGNRMYAWDDSYQSKDRALSRARQLRSDFGPARVVKDTFGWGVYYRPRKGWTHERKARR